MKILGIDLASRSGWCFGTDIATAYYGLWDVPGLDDANINRSCGSIYSAVNTTCRANGIEGVVIEAALMGITRKNKRGIATPTSRHGDRVLGMIAGAARAGASNAGVKHMWFPGAPTWRKEVLGNGYPDKPKDAAIAFCAMMGKRITDHNVAEALCLMSYGHGKQNLLDRIKP